MAEAKRRLHISWYWALPAAVALVLIGGMIAWWLRGASLWSDGRSISASTAAAKPRQILWTPPEPMGDEFASDQEVYEPCFSGDGLEMYFSRGKPGEGAHIYASYQHDGHWSKPAPLKDVNSAADDLGPRLSADGRTLFFYSNRKGGLGGFDIWAATRSGSDGSNWNGAVNLGPAVNSEFDEYNPCPSPDGRSLVFATNRTAAKRQQADAWRATIRQTANVDFDLWIAQRDAATPATQPATPQYQPAAEIPGVNSAYTEGSPCFSPGGDFLYFASNRLGGFGKFDLYRSRAEGDSFGPVENLGAEINTPDNETDPALAIGGYRLCFSSDRPATGRTAGEYQLFQTESHEVFLQRIPRPLPKLGLSGWLLLASVLLLFPLLLLLRHWNSPHITLIQRCLLMSVLAHVLITFCLTFVQVTQKVSNYVRQQHEQEMAIHFGPPADVAVRLAVRSQTSDSLPLQTAAPTALAATPLPTAPEPTGPQPIAVEAPHATVLPELEKLPAPNVNPTAAVVAIAQAPPPSPVKPDLSPVPPPAFTPPTPAALRQDQPREKIEMAQATPTQRVTSDPILPRLDLAQPTAPAAAQTPVDTAMPIRQMAPTATPIANPQTPDLQPPDAIATVTPNTPLPNAAKIDGPSALPTPTAAKPEATQQQLSPTATVARQFMPDVQQNRTDPAQMMFPTTRASIPDAVAQVQMPNITAAPAPVATATVNPAPPMPATQPAANQAVAMSVNAPAPPPAQRFVPSSNQTTAAAAIAVPTAAPATGSAPLAEAARLNGSVANVAPVSIAAPQSIGTADNSVAIPAVTNATPQLPGMTAAPVAIADHPATLPAVAAAPTRLASSSDAIPAAHVQAVAIGEPAAPAHAQNSTTPVASGAAPPHPGMQAVAVPVAVGDPAASDSVAAAVPITGQLGPTGMLAPETPYLRAEQQRRPLLAQMGGNAKSEDAVDQGLAYLARVQEADGSWSDAEAKRDVHRSALTALSVLAFLARDNTPAKPGPYKETVTRGIDYLISIQGEDGDLRGAPHLRGNRASSADMYDHGMASLALSEAAVMTHDSRYVAAAIKAAQFIVHAQDPNGGGWRYAPGQAGDSSVLGWQIMALHSAEQVGFTIPEKTRQLALRYINSATSGPNKTLGTYQPNHPPTPAMTAELLFARMLLGQSLTPEQEKEATDYLTRPGNETDLYYWYYASLCMIQMHSDAWKTWNTQIRDGLIKLQEPGEAPKPENVAVPAADVNKPPALAGSWPIKLRWGDRGGRIYTTAFSTLTLEVYYRYLPLHPTTQP